MSTSCPGCSDRKRRRPARGDGTLRRRAEPPADTPALLTADSAANQRPENVLRDLPEALRRIKTHQTTEAPVDLFVYCSANVLAAAGSFLLTKNTRILKPLHTIRMVKSVKNQLLSSIAEHKLQLESFCCFSSEIKTFKIFVTPNKRAQDCSVFCSSCRKRT